MRVIIILSDLILPAFMFAFGYFYMTKSAEDINSLVGYKTSMSTKNDDTWQFAHQYCGKLWTRNGAVLFAVSFLACLITAILTDHQVLGILSIILVIAQAIVIIASIFPVEKALKDTFDDEGNRK